MIRVLMVLLPLAACASHKPGAPVVVHEKVHVEPCRPGSPQPATPKPPRTTAIIADAFNKAKTAGLETEAALRECAAKVELLLNQR